MMTVLRKFLTVTLLTVIAAPPAMADTPLPMEAIGRLGPPSLDRPNCTAALVGHDTVLTAGHCIGPAGTTGRFGTTRLRFQPGRDGDDVPSLHRPDAWLRATAASGAPKIAGDAGLITLADPTRTVPIPIGTPPEQGEALIVVGYPKDARGSPVTTGCTTLDTRDDMIFLTCAVSSGMSGAPVLVLRQNRWEIAAVLVGTLGIAGPARSVAIAPAGPGFWDAAPD